MKCPICSSEAEDSAVFCPQCGAKLAAGTANAAAGQTAATGQAHAATLDATGRRRPVTDVPEETLWEGSYSPKAMLGEFLACGLITLGVLVGGIWVGKWIWLSLGLIVMWCLLGILFTARRIGIRYKLTNHMFYHSKGVLKRTIDRVEVINIDDVEWQQTIVDRMVNVGTIKIFSPMDRTNNDDIRNKGLLPVPGIDEVERVAQMIDKARRDERIRRGFLTIEQT